MPRTRTPRQNVVFEGITPGRGAVKVHFTIGTAHSKRFLEVTVPATLFLEEPILAVLDTAARKKLLAHWDMLRDEGQSTIEW